MSIAELNTLLYGKAEGAAELAEKILEILASRKTEEDHIKRIRKLCNQAKKHHQLYLD